MNRLPEEKRKAILGALSSGMSIRQAAHAGGCARRTAQLIAQEASRNAAAEFEQLCERGDFGRAAEARRRSNEFRLWDHCFDCSEPLTPQNQRVQAVGRGRASMMVAVCAPCQEGRWITRAGAAYSCPSCGRFKHFLAAACRGCYDGARHERRQERERSLVLDRAARAEARRAARAARLDEQLRRGRPVAQFWPFLVVRENRENDLLLRINAALPRSLPEHARQEVGQEVAVAVLSGELDGENLSAASVAPYIKAVWRQYPSHHHGAPLSLDQPPPWARGDDRPLSEQIADLRESWNGSEPEEFTFRASFGELVRSRRLEAEAPQLALAGSGESSPPAPWRRYESGNNRGKTRQRVQLSLDAAARRMSHFPR